MRLVATLVLALATFSASADDLDVSRERFNALFPQIHSQEFSASPVNGLIEVRTADALFYFAPEPGLLLFGELFDPAGISLTGTRREALSIARVTHLVEAPAQTTPALSVLGSPITKGPVAVTAYLDIHCGYCAQAVDWIIREKGLPGAALNVVFVSRDESDRARAEHVLCAPPHLRAIALQQVFARGLDVEWLRCERGHSDALAHEGIAAENGVSATPVFAVSGQTVLGFNRERLESLVDRQSH